MSLPVSAISFAINSRERDTFHAYMDTSEDFISEVSPRTSPQKDLFNASMSSSNDSNSILYTRLDTSHSSLVSPLTTPQTQDNFIVKSDQKQKQSFELSSNMDSSLENDSASFEASPASISETPKREPFREYTNSPTGNFYETSPRMLLKNAMEIDKMSSQSLTTNVSPQSSKNKSGLQLFLTPSYHNTDYSFSPQQYTVFPPGEGQKWRIKACAVEPEENLFIPSLKPSYNHDTKEGKIDEENLTSQLSAAVSLIQYFDEKGLTGDMLEICEMFSNEEATLPQSDYAQEQNESQWFDRSIIMDLLITTHQRLNRQEKTLHLAANIIDRFLLQHSIDLCQLHILCAASLTLAIGVEEESIELLIGEIMREIGVQDSESDMLAEMTELLTQTLGCSFGSYISPVYWLACIGKSEDFIQETRTFSFYFVDIPVIYRPLLPVKPSLVAAAAAWLSRLILSTAQFEWTPDLIRFSGYDKDKIIPVANGMLTYCLKKDTVSDCLTKKYSTYKYKQVAPLVKNWALRYWSEGDQVFLEEWLPYIVEMAELWDT